MCNDKGDFDSDIRVHSHIRMHPRTYGHTHTRPYPPTHIRPHICTHLHAHTHAPTHICTYSTHTNATTPIGMHPRPYAPTHAPTLIRTHAHTHTYATPAICTYAQTHPHACTHAHTHAPTPICTYAPTFKIFKMPLHCVHLLIYFKFFIDLTRAGYGQPAGRMWPPDCTTPRSVLDRPDFPSS